MGGIARRDAPVRAEQREQVGPARQHHRPSGIGRRDQHQRMGGSRRTPPRSDVRRRR